MYLYQEADGFLFNSDAHFLYDFISQFKPKGDVLDIGAGCGILGLLVARDFHVTLTMIDKQPHNTLLCQHNARVNQIEATIIEDDFLHHDFDKKYDYILSNPPYYHQGVTSSQTDKIAIAKENIHMPVQSMIQKINTLIKPRGHLIFCYDAKQLPNLLHSLHEVKFRVEDIRFVHGTEDKPAHLVMIHARKGSLALCKIHPPLINFVDKMQTKEVKSIYQKTRTYSIKCNIK